LPSQIESSHNFLKKKIEKFISQGRNRFYLSEMVEETHVPIRDVENFLIPLLEKNKIEGTLEVRCPNCGADQGTFKKYYEIPSEIECEICGYEFPRSDEYLNIVLEVKGKFFRAQNVPSNLRRKDTHDRRTKTAFRRCDGRT